MSPEVLLGAQRIEPHRAQRIVPAPCSLSWSAMHPGELTSRPTATLKIANTGARRPLR
jgi:hypothetical protein